MPKINTYSEENPAFLRMPDGNEYYPPESDKYQQQGGVWLRRNVSVSWVKEKYLELGVSSKDISTDWVSEGTFITLDRVSANRIIRALQEGRNGAFGKDA